MEDVKSQQLPSNDLSKLAEGTKEGGDAVRQHEECARQLKCAAYVCRAMRTLSRAGATEAQIECVGRKALGGCLYELDKDAWNPSGRSCAGVLVVAKRKLWDAPSGS